MWDCISPSPPSSDRPTELRKPTLLHCWRSIPRAPPHSLIATSQAKRSSSHRTTSFRDVEIWQMVEPEVVGARESLLAMGTIPGITACSRSPRSNVSPLSFILSLMDVPQLHLDVVYNKILLGVGNPGAHCSKTSTHVLSLAIHVVGLCSRAQMICQDDCFAINSQGYS